MTHFGLIQILSTSQIFLLVIDIAAMGISWLFIAGHIPPTIHFSNFPVLPIQCHFVIPAVYWLYSDGWGKQITSTMAVVQKGHCLLGSKWWTGVRSQLVPMSGSNSPSQGQGTETHPIRDIILNVHNIYLFLKFEYQTISRSNDFINKIFQIFKSTL